MKNLVLQKLISDLRFGVGFAAMLMLVIFSLIPSSTSAINGHAPLVVDSLHIQQDADILEAVSKTREPIVRPLFRVKTPEKPPDNPDKRLALWAALGLVFGVLSVAILFFGLVGLIGGPILLLTFLSAVMSLGLSFPALKRLDKWRKGLRAMAIVGIVFSGIGLLIAGLIQVLIWILSR